MGKIFKLYKKILICEVIFSILITSIIYISGFICEYHKKCQKEKSIIEYVKKSDASDIEYLSEYGWVKENKKIFEIKNPKEREYFRTFIRTLEVKKLMTKEADAD